MQDSLQTDAIKETLTQLEEAQKEEKQVPTAIVPPVQQPPKPPVVPKPQSNWQPLQPQKNIVNISIRQEDDGWFIFELKYLYFVTEPNSC